MENIIMSINATIYVLILVMVLGILLLWTGMSRWKERLSCKEQIQGIFLCCDVLGFGNHIYTSAKFEYTYKGSKIKQYAMEKLSGKKRNKLQKGKMYILYVNPKNPRIIRCTKKVIYFEDFFQVILGSFFTLGSFFSLLEQLIRYAF